MTDTHESPPLAPPPLRRRRRWRVGLAVVALVAVLAAVVGWRTLAVENPTISSALDEYTAAVASGDRDALEASIGEGPGHAALVERHVGQPATVTGVTMDMSVSSAMWEVELRYELPGGEAAPERLMVLPRDAPPDRAPDFVVVPVT